MWNLVLLCRRHHVLWHLGKFRLHHLHAPWHPDTTPATDAWTDLLATQPAGP